VEEDKAAHEDGADTGDEHGGGGHVQTRPDARLGTRVKTAKQSLNRAIEKLRGKYHANAAHEQTPFHETASEDDSGYQRQCGEEEVDEKAGMSPNPQLQTAKRIADLGAP
jgi:hypothetical protein